MSDAAGHPPLGGVVPAFDLVNQFGESRRLEDELDAASLLVFFPLVHTPVCESELAALAGRQEEWARRGYRVAAISVDHRYSLRDAADRLGVGFDLLSDFWPHGEIARSYGCFDHERGHATRASFVLDAAGRLTRVITSSHGAPRDAAEYDAALAGAAG